MKIAFIKADAPTKQKLVGSIFPEKFQLTDNQVRTTRVNEVIERICRKIKGLEGNKKGQQSFYELLP